MKTMIEELRTAIIETVERYEGQKEIAGNQGFQEQWFDELMKDYGHLKGDQWCALFAEAAWRGGYSVALRNNKPRQREMDVVLNSLFSKAAQQTMKNFRAAGWEVNSRVPEAGDLVIWKRGRDLWRGHIGVVIDAGDVMTKKFFTTMEGNTSEEGVPDGGEAKRLRRELVFTNNMSGLNLLGFVKPKI